MKNMKKVLATVIIALSLLTISPTNLPYTNVLTVEAAAKVKINKTKATVIVGKGLQLKITGSKTKVKWSTSNKSVATVSNNGKVTAKKSGTATITALVNNKKYYCKVTVKRAPKLVTNIITTCESLKVPQNAQFAFNATPYPTTADNKSLKWKSSDETVVKVDEVGNCFAVKEGTTTIYAITTDGSNITAKWDIIVTNDFSKLASTVSQDITINLSEMKTIRIDYDSYLSNESLYYNLSNPILNAEWGGNAEYLTITPNKTGITYLTITSNKYLGEYKIKVTVVDDSSDQQTVTPTPSVSTVPSTTPNIIDNTDKIKSIQSKISRANNTLNSYKSTLASYTSRLSKAQANLEKAQTQKTIRVYKEGEGFVYEVDTNAIRNAQNDVNEYQAYVTEYSNLVTTKEAEISSLQAELDAIH